MKKYVIGIDYGSLSGRAVLVDVENGNEIATGILEYPHAVISDFIPNTNIKLEHDWALQHPSDYVQVLEKTIPEILKTSGVSADSVIGIGIDFTACTMMPVNEKGQALCQVAKHYSNPHAWIKLWKHHSAQKYADIVNEVGQDFGFLPRYGGKISSEWFIPKVFQIYAEAPEIYNECYTFMEATDWITMQLTGNWVRSNCTLGYKAIWNPEDGFLPKEFFSRLAPGMENFIADKMQVGEIKNIGTSAGTLTSEWATKLGLNPGITISVGNVDAHVSVASSKMIKENSMLMIMGTSTCDISLSSVEKDVKGICGVLENGAIDGYYAYESGQNAVGDIFDWFTSNNINAKYEKQAKDRGVSIHTVLEEKASRLKIGESGLLALDWLNGNRSVLVDTDLTGVILGLNLHTKSEEIYRALIEATAFGKKRILESFEDSGIVIEDLYACGGLPNKNKMLMQIYADVCNKPIYIAKSQNAPALGSAMFAAVAAGAEVGGYSTIFDAAANMAHLKDEVFTPIPENVEKYKVIYDEYSKLHDYFGLENNVMKRLKKIKENA